MAKYVLGLDIGITSVGYGVIDFDTGEFVDYGVRLFKESTAADNAQRREKRGGRRLKSRKRTRLRDMKELLKENNILNDDLVLNSNPYKIRCKGLNEKLSNDELAIALLHITKNRGSSLETVEDDEAKIEEAESAKAELSKNSALLKEGKYVCEIQLGRLEDEKIKVRGSHNNFKTTDYLDEARKILSNQDIDEVLIEKIISLIERKRQYYEGPGSEISPTPYGRFIENNGVIEKIDLIEKMRGKCSVYPDQSRAPKMSYSAELFNLLNDLNNLTVEGEKLTKEDKEKVIAFVDKEGGITPTKLMKLLGTKIEDVSGFRIDTKDKQIITEFKGYKIIKKVFDQFDLTDVIEDKQIVDQIVEILTKTKGIKERFDLITEISDKITEELAVELSQLSRISGYHALSYKAINELNKELLETSLNQMQILHSSGLFEKYRKSTKGDKNISADAEAILSPVAKRAQRETFKVINALRKRHGEFDTIVVETTRDKNSDEERKRIKDTQSFYKKQKDEVDQILQKEGYNSEIISGAIKQKLRLYLQQDGKSAYTLQPLDIRLIIKDPNAYEIDHIIPISISLDDSINNKVLVTHSENQNKGNLTPVDAYLKGKFNYSGCTLEKYKTFTKLNRYSKKKKEYLLFKEDITKYSVIKEFINRNLIDTSYANRVVLNTLSGYFKDNEIDTKVHTIRGSATSAFRKRINLKKDRDEDYSHHAIDALIVASLKKVNLLNTYLSKYKLEELYDEATGEVFKVEEDKEYLSPKYIEYIKQLKDLKVTKFSHKIDTKPNRQIANETIYSTRNVDGKDIVVEKYKDIYDPKFTRLTDDIINGNRDKYLMAKHDPKTFEIIESIILNHFNQFKDNKDYYDYDSKKKLYKLKIKVTQKEGEVNVVNPLSEHFEENGYIRKYAKKNNGAIVKQIKYYSKELGSHVPITKNYNTTTKKVVLLQISPYRTDFYISPSGKYKIVTIRYKDVYYSDKAEKYIIDKEKYNLLKEAKGIDGDYNFVASFHRDELIGITKKEGSKYIYNPLESKELLHDGKTPEILKFTATCDDKENRVEVKPINAYCKTQLRATTGTFINVEKYATDVLGNLYKVKQNELKLEL